MKIHVHVHVHVDYAFIIYAVHVKYNTYCKCMISFYSLDVNKPPEDTGLIPSASTTCAFWWLSLTAQNTLQ